MPGIIEGEWDLINIPIVVMACIILILCFFGVIFPYLMQHVECDFPCGCHIEGKPYDPNIGTVVRHFYADAETGYLYAELCNGKTMQVNHFEGSVPV